MRDTSFLAITVREHEIVTTPGRPGRWSVTSTPPVPGVTPAAISQRGQAVWEVWLHGALSPIVCHSLRGAHTVVVRRLKRTVGPVGVSGDR